MNEERRPPRWLEIGAYLAVALWAIGPALRSGAVVGSGVDLYGTLWFYWWTQECIRTLSDPGFTDLFFHPLGKDIFAHTGNNLLDAAAAAPLYWLLGNPTYEPWFAGGILVLNALTFRKLAVYVLGAPWAAFAAALAWELNPYVAFEITCGRLTQGFLPFLPLSFYHLLRCEERGAGWRHPLLAGLFTALQAWTYWFMGWFMAFAFAWIGLYGIWRARAEGTGTARLAGRYLAAGAAAVAGITPALIAMAAAAAAGEVPGLSVEAGSLFEPPPAQANNVSTNLHGLLLMERWGVPILGSWAWGGAAALWILLGGGGRLRRARWLPAALIVTLFAIGPALEIPGRGPTVMPHYMAAYYYLPWFDRLWFPYRMMGAPVMIVALAIGALSLRLGAALRDRLPGPGAAASLALLGAGWIALTGWEQGRYRVLPFATTAVEPPPTVLWMADQGGGIVDMPYGIYSESVVWQTFHGLPLFGGMGENASLLWPEGHRARLRQRLIKALSKAARDQRWEAPEIEARHVEEVQSWGFRWIALQRALIRADLRPTAGPVDPNTDEDLARRAEALERFTAILGPPTAADERLVIWDLTGEGRPPEAIAPDPDALAAPVYAPDPRPAYEIALQESGRLKHSGPPGEAPERPEKKQQRRER